MGAFLNDLNLIPDEIICSTAVRARKTIAGLLENLPFDDQVIYTRDLYHADVDTMLEQLHPLPGGVEIAMLVGHNPGMDDFLEVVCDEPEHMPTAAIAEIEFDISRWDELRGDTPGELKNLWGPKEIGGQS
jgi:phosphohistidine phosphatase